MTRSHAPGRLRAWATAIGYGARGRCPRCGDAPLFERWNRVRPRCTACGLRYLLNQGDPWVFLLVLDRAVFIFPPIVVIYFGFLPESTPGIVAIFAAIVAALVYTTPHRYGICVALDWLTRADDADGAIGYSSTPSVAGDRAATQTEHDRG